MDPYGLLGMCYTDSPDGNGLQMEDVIVGRSDILRVEVLTD